MTESNGENSVLTCVEESRIVKTGKEVPFMKLLLVFLSMVFAAMAADLTGTWKGTAETPNGTIERTFVFKAEGAKVTGESTSAMFGKAPITDGKIEDGVLSFTLTVRFQDNDMKVVYKGKTGGSEMNLTGELPNGETFEYKLKKVS